MPSPRRRNGTSTRPARSRRTCRGWPNRVRGACCTWPGWRRCRWIPAWLIESRCVMHEMSLAEGVLQIIEDAAQAQQFGRVTTVWLEIGQLAGVEVEAMRFCFDAVTRDTIADGAKLE